VPQENRQECPVLKNKEHQPLSFPSKLSKLVTHMKLNFNLRRWQFQNKKLKSNGWRQQLLLWMLSALLLMIMPNMLKIQPLNTMSLNTKEWNFTRISKQLLRKFTRTTLPILSSKTVKMPPLVIWIQPLRLKSKSITKITLHIKMKRKSCKLITLRDMSQLKMSLRKIEVLWPLRKMLKELLWFQREKVLDLIWQTNTTPWKVNSRMNTSKWEINFKMRMRTKEMICKDNLKMLIALGLTNTRECKMNWENNFRIQLLQWTSSMKKQELSYKLKMKPI